MSKRYYWLKLKKDFFRDPKIMLIQRKKRGKEILLFYIFLLTESIEGNGRLAYDDGRGYDEKELAQLSGFTESMVHLSLETLISSGFVHREENGVLVMNGLSEMVGSETSEAEKKRKNRSKARGQCPDNVPESKRKEIEIDKEIDQESEKEEERDGGFLVDPGRDWMELTQQERVPLSQEQLHDIVRRMGPDIATHYLEKLDEFAALKHRCIKDPYGLILKWYGEDYGYSLV